MDMCNMHMNTWSYGTVTYIYNFLALFALFLSFMSIAARQFVLETLKFYIQIIYLTHICKCDLFWSHKHMHLYKHMHYLCTKVIFYFKIKNIWIL